MLLRALLFVTIMSFSAPAFAQEDDFAQRLALAEKMLEIRPAGEQLRSALDQYIQSYLVRYPETEKQIFRASILKAVNEKALEKTAVDAYAEIFTLKELEAMLEFYAKPEARAIREKQGELNARVKPEIIRMLDQALMKVRLEVQTP